MSKHPEFPSPTSTLLLLCLALHAGARPTGSDAARHEVLHSPTFRGNWPAGDCDRMCSVRLAGQEGECVAVGRRDEIEVLHLGHRSWHRVGGIARDTTHPEPVIWNWTTGDVDDDGNDEVIVWQDSQVTSYSWDGSSFRSRTAVFPWPLEQILVGDANNDGRNELVVLGGDSVLLDLEDYPCYLFLATWHNPEPVVIWNDHRRLGYRAFSAPPIIECIADIQNLGFNQVIISEAQSDVRPTLFDVLIWNDDRSRLEPKLTFSVHDRLLFFADSTPYDSSHDLPFLSGELRAGIANDTTLLLGDVVSTPSYGFAVAVIRIEGDSIASERLLNEAPGPGFEDCFIDPDDRGQGVLVVSHGEYWFHRI